METVSASDVCLEMNQEKALVLNPEVSPEGIKNSFEEKLTSVLDYSKEKLLKDFSPDIEKMTNLNFDPLKAKYFEDFMSDPVQVTKQLDIEREKVRKEKGDDYYYEILMSEKHHPLKRKRQYDFRLSKDELEVFKKNGMVVSERLNVDTFAEAYYRIYTDDLPVYVTADSILHAWHRSFDDILKEIETECFFKTMREILEKFHEEIEQLNRIHLEQTSEIADEILPFETILKELDLYFTIAISLFHGKPMENSVFNTDMTQKKILSILSKIQNAQGIEDLEIFGLTRELDFSQFQPRGHYTETDQLKKYFRGMMWLGKVELYLAHSKKASAQQVSTMMILYGILKLNPTLEEKWNELNQVLTLFIGTMDCVTFDHLKQLPTLASIFIKEVTSTNKLNAYATLRTLVQRSKIDSLTRELEIQGIGKQAILGSLEVSENPLGPVELPQVFMFMGQRFILDSFAMSSVVYDRIWWEGKEIKRRYPQALDVAFSVFGNNASVSDIVKDMTDGNQTFRDGLPYAHNLVALRHVIDELDIQEEGKAWKESIYSMWLYTLRALSSKSPHSSSSFHTTAWNLHHMNTQLASWAELRHDTILYAKQSFTMGTMCEYPDGFVDPIPEFWSRMKNMAKKTANLLSTLTLYDEQEQDPNRRFYPRFSRQGHIEFFELFASIVEKLETISKKQIKGEKLNESENSFLKTVMEESFGSGASRYLGWYPQLFYKEREDAGKWKPVVSDVHTNAGDEQIGDPGCILYEGVGNVPMAFVAVETGQNGNSDVRMYAGPVYSFYEFTRPLSGPRLTDADWENMLKTPKDLPSLPSWATSTYLVQSS